ncbi:MAG: hypothetical protein Q9202_002308 [Teloschistes flavicans]
MASWQVDIPSLSNLVASAGAHGLKQLALSGVDIHTLGCMLMVSELIPACQDFRLNLNTRREKQRGERRWLFNAVELGAGTSFLVDHLLKTRAGENVLSLMASIVPLLSPEACVVALSSLFDIAGVKPDHTPGVGQLHKLRNAVVPFSQSVGFQERVLQYHALFERIVGPRSDPDELGPYDAMPDKHTLSRIVQCCHKIATAENTTVLVWKGFTGSGWVAAYASCILGFPVCAINGAGEQLPINDHYARAKVFLHLAAESSTCEIHIEGHLSEFIHVNGLGPLSDCGSWSIDCLELNFLRHNLPDFSVPSFVGTFSEIVAMQTLNQLPLALAAFHETQPVPGFQPYMLDVLPRIQARSMDILALLGFYRQEVAGFRPDEDRQWHNSLNDPDLAKDFKDFIEQHPDQYRIHHICPEALFRTFKRRLPEQPSDDAMTHICDVLNTAVWLASTLAFTDWNSGLRKIAARNFHASSSYFKRRFSGKRICLDILETCVNARRSMTLRKLDMFDPDWVALNFDGVIILRTLAVSESIHKAQGKVYSLLAGHILFDGEQKEALLQEPGYTLPSSSRSIRSGLTHKQQIGPENFVPSLQSRQFFSGSGETLFVRHEILKDQVLFAFASPASIAMATLDSWVALPCQHSYYSVIDRNIQIFSDSWPEHFRFSAGILYDCRSDDPVISILYQQVDNNELGQWLMYSAKNFVDSNVIVVHILQRETCINCILNRIILWERSIDDEKRSSGQKSKTVYWIIAGRIDA